MSAFSRFAVALLLVLSSTAPVFAGMAMIETAAPLGERSNEGVKSAVVMAVENAVRGAKAMGLPRVALNGVRVLPSMVVVRILATDTASDSAPSAPDEQDRRDRDQHDQDIEPGPLGSGEVNGVHAHGGTEALGP